MPNNYFQFKQFKIHQDKCAQKVGTDSVMLGAWINATNCNTALDIGSGTGLISLMLAQKSLKKITAVEVDELAFKQSVANVKHSVFSDVIKLYNIAIQEYSKIETGKFDIIVSNPPFYQHHLKSDNEQRNIARHNDSLTYNDLIVSAAKLLNKTGKFCVVIPKDDMEIFKDIGNSEKLFLNRVLYVKPTPTKQAKRVLLEFGFVKKELKQEELIVEIAGRHNYSKEYISLTKDFYLNF